MVTSDSDSEKPKKEMTAMFYIPPGEIRDVNYKVLDVSIKTVNEDSGKLVFLYAVKWKEEERKVERYYVEDFEDEAEMDRKVAEHKKRVHDERKYGGLGCDGPCGKWYIMKDLIEFGCDHAICKQCRQTAKSAILFDGSPGCSNKKCVAEAEAKGEKVMVGRSLSDVPSDLSMRSNEGPWEVLAVHVVVMRKMVGQVFKTRLEFEFPSQARIASLAKALSEYKDIVKSGVSYFSLKKPKSRKDLDLISVKDTNLRFYHLPGYAFTSGKVYFVVVGRGIK